MTKSSTTNGSVGHRVGIKVRSRPRILHGSICMLMSAAIASSGVIPAYAQQSTSISRAEYAACHTQDEAAFRSAIEAITLATLKAGAARIDYGSIVRDEWRRQQFDALIDARVDLAVNAIRKETSWAQLLKTLAYREQAKQLAVNMAERVYRSDALKSGLDRLATGVGKQIGNAIELSTIDAALPARKCFEAFLGPRYGDAVSKVVSRDAGAAFQVDASASRVAVSTGAVVKEASGGLAGAVILIVRRQLARMAQRLGQRLAGAVLSRLVSVVATGVGVVLIAKDAWDFRHGVLPIIASEMKTPDTKLKVQAELAKAIEAQISRQVEVLAGQTADQIMAIWKTFRRNHEKVLDLAERHADFRRFLDAAPDNRMARLDEIVGLSLRAGGEPAVLRRLSDGTLGTALNDLPDDGMQIARELNSLETALAWYAVAGTRLPEVRAAELHRHAQPANFTSTSLEQLLALDDRPAIIRLAGLPAAARGRLFDLPAESLASLAARLSRAELATLASYLVGLRREASDRVLKTVSQSPGTMRSLAPASVRQAIIASRNQVAAVDMMLATTDARFDFSDLLGDVRLATTGAVKPVLVWHKHPAAVIAAGVAALMLLMVVMRLFSGGRRTRTAPAPYAARTHSRQAGTPGRTPDRET